MYVTRAIITIITLCAFTLMLWTLLELNAANASHACVYDNL